MSTSFKVQVIADETSKWLDNGMRFATYQDADHYGRDLASRWTAVRAFRVIESNDPVNEPRKNAP
jgi:hypothetical protein